MEKQRVLFLCNANSARSLMGETMLRHMAVDHNSTESLARYQVQRRPLPESVYPEPTFSRLRSSKIALQT